MSNTKIDLTRPASTTRLVTRQSYLVHQPDGRGAYNVEVVCHDGITYHADRVEVDQGHFRLFVQGAGGIFYSTLLPIYDVLSIH